MAFSRDTNSKNRSMRDNRAALGVLLAVCVLSFGAEVAHADCKPPREGVWILDVYEPRQSSGEFTPKIDFEAQTNVGKALLRQHPAEPSIYTGFAVLGTDPVTTTYNRMDFNLIWDPVLCELYGSATFPYVFFFAHLQWKIRDDAIYGYYEVMYEGIILFPYTSMHVLKYAGPEEDYPPF